MHPAKRNCFYQDEKALDFFPVYSEPNCALECAWKHAKTKCGCEPWFLVQVFGDNVPMCEVYSNICFKDIVNTRYSKEFGDPKCMDSCLQDCDEYAYFTTVVPKSKNSYS